MRSQFQDIIPPDKRSIRNIPLPDEKISRKNRKIEKEADNIKNTDIDEKTIGSQVSFSKGETLVFRGAPRVGGLSKLVLWLITIACVGILFFAVTWLFTSATVIVNQKKASVALSGPLEFAINPASGEAGYSTVLFSDTISVTLLATGEKEVSDRASGTIVIYNNFGTGEQKLVSGTRFETSKGLIYKLNETITVPSKHTEGGKTVPGSLEVKVIAEKAGQDYNIGLTDFTIPGFKGSAKFEGFYARSKTAMSGGIIGKIATIDDATLIAEVNKLKKDYGLKLIEKVKQQMPSNQTVIDGLEDASFEITPPKLENGKAKIEVTGNIKYFTLDTQSLARTILASQNIQLSDKDTFDVDTSEVNVSSSSEANGRLRGSFKGNVKITYHLDIDGFKKVLAGKSKNDTQKIVAEFPQIVSLRTELRPFWKISFPDNPDKITVNTE